MSATFGRVAVLGLGLIGGSLMHAVRQSGLDVVGYDIDPATAAAASASGYPVTPTDAAAVHGADLVVLAMPLPQVPDALRSLAPHLAPGALLTDVGTLKQPVHAAVREIVPHARFVGGHPLAGAAKGGLEHARADLFEGRPWLLTSPASRQAGVDRLQPSDNGGAALDKLTAFVTALGAEPRVVDSRAHDRLLAFLSHLPQLTASALMQVVGDAVGQDVLSLAGRGLADTTRLASSPPDIWKDIVATNADEIGPALDALIDVLTDLRRDLSEGERLEEVFTDAARWRSAIKR